MSISGINSNSHTLRALNGTQNETITAQCLRSLDPELDLDCCTTGVCLKWWGQPTPWLACDKNDHCNLTNAGIAYFTILAIIAIFVICCLAAGCNHIKCCGLFDCCGSFDYLEYCCAFFENQAGQSAHGRPSNVAQSSGLPTNVAAYGQNAVTYNAAYCRDGSPSISGEESVSGEGSHSGERSPTSALANSVDTGSIKAGSKEKMPQECSVSLEGSPSGEGASALANSAKTGNIKAGTKEKLPKECSVSGEGSPLGERSPSVKEFPSGERSPASALTNSAETGSIKDETKEKRPRECSVSG